ncbi:MAG: DUF2029 domain-containing protein [Clostridia bacterium]|nr:DUF2029 domain-containing protein [Deltaproteobacteria bacterium]
MAIGVAFLPVGSRGIGYIAANVTATLAMTVAYRSVVSNRDIWWLGSAGILARLLLVAVPPYTTHDVARYMFDGAMAVAGLDPYSVANGSPRALPLHLIWPSAIEHAAYPTIYPPLAVALFSLCARFGPAYAWLVWKLIVGLASSAIVLVAARFASSRRLTVLVALSPLLLFEGGIGGHLDVLCALAVTLALTSERPQVQGAWLGVGVLVKLTPAFIVVPLVAGMWRAERRAALMLLVGFLLVIVTGYVVANQLGFQALGSLQVFFTKWSFGSPWMLVEDMIGMPRSQLLRIGTVVALVMLAMSAKAAWCRSRSVALMLAACAPLLASPVVFPWYLCTAAVLLAFELSPYVFGWMVLAPFTYEVIDRFDVDGSWFPALWPVQLTVALTGVLLILRPHEALFCRSSRSESKP